ncbi:hypothetical protein TSUD_190060 [Trifolium subterraneum]|uniref:Reverse transcriptase domain-containing protein n=1 Tax=Trifolium subterraneum TaxID=3900 RepID=A0A2Z6P9B2_TRISU|nr:hypothetical protein TSUD_190060 [Trifolium subterraneum]
MRVKVKVDVRRPLKIEKKIMLNGGLGAVVKFKYERLGLFCFVCGVIGHSDNKCEVKYAMERDDGNRGWSNEIKAEVRRPGGRVESRWLREDRSMGGVHTDCHASQRESQSSGSSQSNETQPRPRDNGSDSYQGGNEVVVAGRNITPSMTTSMGSPHPNHELSIIPLAATSSVSRRPTLTLSNDRDTRQVGNAIAERSNPQISHLDGNEMEVQVERKRRRADGTSSEEINVSVQQHFLSAAIDVEGRSGGLTVFWKDSSMCQVVNYTRNFINMIVKDEQWGEWRLTCYYGFPERSRRRAAWDLLRELRNMSSIPWCIIGDFNDLLSQADKKGIHPHPNGLCMGFRQAVSDCDLTDIPIEGHLFTWIKSRGTPHVIEERLDRAMVSASWLQLFPQVSLLKEPDLENVVVDGWGGRENLEVVDRVTRCANKLQRRMNELRGNQDEEVSLQYQELSEKHATLLIQEEGYWKQRAKMHWLQEGDMNTRFFHMSATVRNKKKKVTKLVADNGTEAHTQEELCEVAKIYFDNLFKPRDGDHDPVLNLIQPRVTDDDNFFLTAAITKDEIQQALFQMHPDKSPGPDGFNPAFYQKLKCCLDKCVSQEQSAFVEGRSILDNALIATEVIHALKRKTQGRRGELALKIDISKAYDKVDWGFLRGVMTKMGFTDVWIRSRLRQGDPLSPYLFILVTECLTALIHQSVGRGDIHGVRICRGAPEVSHLLFADDCFLFCRANVVEAGKEIMIKSVLQAISSYVMSMFILPTSLIDDIEKMINAFWWRSGTINNNNNNNKGIHWLAWERLACPKAHGGLGFRNFEAFNRAMVAKQAWNIVQNPNLLVAKLIKARYFPRSSLFETPLGYNSSFAWRSMWHARQILSLGCRWRIGSGENIRVMHDPWLRGKVNKWVSSPQPAGVYQLSVIDLLHENYKAWNIVKVRNFFSGDVAERILETPLVNSVREDKVVWEEERNGCYSVKSGYKLAMRYIIGSDKYHVVGNWNGIWKAQAPHKARHLLWRLCRGCLPTRYRLLERRVECNLNCPVCDEEIEDDIHIFFRCAVSRDSWCAAGLSSVLHSDAYQQSNAMDRIFAVCSNESSDIVGRMAMLLWCIWQNRNDKLWNGNVQTPRQIGRYAFDAWNDWYSVHKLQSNSESKTTEANLVRWEKPALGWVKCNVDVAFVPGSGRTSVGLCFRNNRGQVMAGMTHWQQTVMSSVEGEVWALLLAMEEARHRGLDRVQFESD